MSDWTGDGPFAARQQIITRRRRRTGGPDRYLVKPVRRVSHLGTPPHGGEQGDGQADSCQAGLILPRSANGSLEPSPVVARVPGLQPRDRHVDRLHPDIAMGDRLPGFPGPSDRRVDHRSRSNRHRDIGPFTLGARRPFRHRPHPGPRALRRQIEPRLRFGPIHRLGRTHRLARALPFQLLQRLVEAQHELLPRQQHRRHPRPDRAGLVRSLRRAHPRPAPAGYRERALTRRCPRARHQRDRDRRPRLDRSRPRLLAREFEGQRQYRRHQRQRRVVQCHQLHRGRRTRRRTDSSPSLSARPRTPMSATHRAVAVTVGGTEGGDVGVSPAVPVPVPVSSSIERLKATSSASSRPAVAA